MRMLAILQFPFNTRLHVHCSITQSFVKALYQADARKL